jgi:hypothetical protein
MTVYIAEEFTAEEADVLRRYFTNLDQPVFALVNLPEVVKGALFARYSRTALSLRRLFLKEFVGELDIEGDQSIDATIGLRRAENSTTRSSSNTATTLSPSSAASTSRVSRPPTCSPRCSSGVD